MQQKQGARLHFHTHAKSREVRKIRFTERVKGGGVREVGGGEVRSRRAKGENGRRLVSGKPLEATARTRAKLKGGNVSCRD